MIERIIENWLVNTNERNYQLPFCQVLISKGHEILYVAPHGRLEFGKDIISKDRQGIINAYQLKTGNITTSSWDKNYREIVGDLVNSPCDHPNVIDKTIPHVSYLVTNGIIQDDVLQRIDKLNQTKTNFSKLNTITKDQLLLDFIENQNKFMPINLGDIWFFLNFLLKDGREFFPKRDFIYFLDNLFFKNSKTPSNQRNSISSSIILTSYSINNFEQKNNFFAVMEAWACLYVSILKFIEENNMKKIDYAQSLELIYSQIINNLKSMKEEVIGREHFLEGDWLGDGNLVYKARTTMILGLIAMSENYKESSGQREKISEIIKSNINHLWLWGESAFPFFFMIIKFLENISEYKLSRDLLNLLLTIIIDSNYPLNNHNDPKCLVELSNPYYEVEDILCENYGLKNEINFKQFLGSAYILETLIEMCARRKMKSLLKKNWRKISHINIEEFIPDYTFDYFNYHAEDGTNRLKALNEIQRWKELVNDSYNINAIPDIFWRHEEILPFYVITYKHRSSKYVYRLLDIYGNFTHPLTKQ